jgi:hypothetical protein
MKKGKKSIRTLSKIQPSKLLKKSILGEDSPTPRITSWREHWARQKIAQEEIDMIIKKRSNEQKKEEIKRAVERVKMGEKAWATTDKSKDSKKNLPVIKILAERKIAMVELDIDMNSEVKKILMKIGKENILKDEKAIISYGFAHALKNSLRLVKKLK